MLYDLLIVTNIPFLVAALVALHKRFYVWCLLLLLVFVASTAYHSHDHQHWLGVCDRLIAITTCVIIGSVGLFKSSKNWLSLGIVLMVVSMYLFNMVHEEGYSDPEHCLVHSLWHIMASLTSIVLIISIQP